VSKYRAIHDARRNEAQWKCTNLPVTCDRVQTNLCKILQHDC